MPGNRLTTDEEVAIVVEFALGKPKSRIAKEMGRDRATVDVVLKRFDPTEFQQLKNALIASSIDLAALADGELRERFSKKATREKISPAVLNMISGTNKDKLMDLAGLRQPDMGGRGPTDSEVLAQLLDKYENVTVTERIIAAGRKRDEGGPVIDVEGEEVEDGQVQNEDK